MKYNPQAHGYSRTGIHIWLLIIPLLAALLCAFNSCSTLQHGCPSNSGKNYKVGYHPNK